MQTTRDQTQAGGGGTPAPKPDDRRRRQGPAGAPTGRIGEAPSTTGSLLRKPWHPIAILRLLVLVVLVMIGSDTPAERQVLYWGLIGIYATTVLAHVAWHLFRRRRVTDRGGGPLLFLLDAALVSSLIVLRGNGVSGFLAAYFTLVLMAAMISGLGNAVLNAVVVSVVYAAVTQWGRGPEVLLSFPMLSQFIFFFVAAIFMSHIAQVDRSHRHERRTIESALALSTEELRVVRAALHANERITTLGMVSAGVAHELKNPLAAIMSSLDPAVQILDEMQAAIAPGETGQRPGDAEAVELREIFQDCHIACRQLKRLATDLTSIARGGEAVPMPLDPSEAIHAASRILKNRIKPPLRFEPVTKTERTILADPGRVLQVLLNLATNAIDAMEGREGGTLVVRAEDSGPFHVTFVVEDNGPGIPDEIRDRIFEPFFTTKGPGKGTGLGLHLVREITQSLSGTLDLETPAGGGARFRVRLPVYIRRTFTENKDEHEPARLVDRRRRRDDSSGARAHVPAGTL